MITSGPAPPVIREISAPHVAVNRDERRIDAAGHFQALRVNVVDDHFARASEPGDLRVHHTDGSGPDDEHRVAGPRARLFVGIINAGHRLDHRRLGEGDMVGDREDVALRHGERRDADKFREAAVLMNTERSVVRIKMTVAADGQF